MIKDSTKSYSIYKADTKYQIIYRLYLALSQYDPLVQEVFDQARKLRCTWYDYYEKSVTFRPFQVNMLNAVTANFLGDNLQCWMQIQSGKGPWSSEVSGIVKIGQTMTMVSSKNSFDRTKLMSISNGS